jgi:hypothetical protein
MPRQCAAPVLKIGIPYALPCFIFFEALYLQTVFHTDHAAIAWAVMSVLLRSNGSLPQPRQNVGIPPSRFL